MFEALGHVDERYGSETDGEADDEYNDAHDAQVRVDLVVWLQDEEGGEEQKVDNDDKHWVDEERLAAELVDERHTHDGADDVDEAGGEHGVLDVLVLDGRSSEDALRVEEDSVDAAQLLSELKRQTGEEWPAQLLEREQLLERDVLVALAVARLVHHLLHLGVHFLCVAQTAQRLTSSVLISSTIKQTNKQTNKQS